MGLVNSPLTFARLMSVVLQGLIADEILCYLDDIIIATATVKQHQERLDVVFTRLADAGLTINTAKCVFYQRQIKFLGHTLDKNGISPNQAKVEAVLNFPPLKNPKDVK